MIVNDASRVITYPPRVTPQFGAPLKKCHLLYNMFTKSSIIIIIMLMVQATSVTDIMANSFLSSVSDESNKYFDTDDCFIIIASISTGPCCSKGCLVGAMTQSILTLSRDNYFVMLSVVKASVTIMSVVTPSVIMMNGVIISVILLCVV
jgi:hypothetical protein